jgi:hypothetical protein
MSDSGNRSASLFPHPGPSLPPFRTLLIKGSYHSSAPIHLCLSHTSQNPNSKAVLLTPSRQNLVDALTQYHDDRSTLHSEVNRDVDVTSKIDFLSVFYQVFKDVPNDFVGSAIPRRQLILRSFWQCSTDARKDPRFTQRLLLMSYLHCLFSSNPPYIFSQTIRSNRAYNQCLAQSLMKNE